MGLKVENRTGERRVNDERNPVPCPLSVMWTTCSDDGADRTTRDRSLGIASCLAAITDAVS